MAIQLVNGYVDILDEVYKNKSVTADLNSAPELVKLGANKNEISYPQCEVSGLGDYSRTTGYAKGSVSVEFITTKFNYDRGTLIKVDTMDDEETFNIAFGMAGKTLMETKVAPESDAFTFATLAGKEGILKATAGSYADGAALLAALITAKGAMDEAEVPEEGRILYVTPTLYNMVLALDTTKSREVLNSFSKIVKVPQSRFYTAIDLFDGTTSGEEAGHYAKSATGKDINFMIIQKESVIKFDKHVVSDILEPSQILDFDAYASKYRKYGIVDVFNNKTSGIYLSNKA